MVASPAVGATADLSTAPLVGQAAIPSLVRVAQEFVDHRTAALLRSARDVAADVFVPSSGRASVKLQATEQAATAELTARKEVLRSVGEAYTDAKSTLTVDGFDLGPSSITLHVTEDTTLWYAKIVGDEPPFTRWAVSRDFAFLLDDGSWVLASVSMPSEGLAPPNEPTGATPAAMQAAAAEIRTTRSEIQRARIPGKGESSTSQSSQATLGGASAAASYNYAAMSWYAEYYWGPTEANYNHSYRVFSDVGGDCTNFISQIMRYGGWTDVTGFYRDDNAWWYNSLNQTWTWVNVGYWYTFAVLRSHRTILLAYPELMGQADVLQMDFTNDGSKDHSMLASYVTSSGIYLTYHTTNTLRRSLANIKISNPTARYIPHRT